MFRILAVSTLMLAGVSSVAYADVYKWIDDHGTVHYTDQWVPGSQLIKSTKTRPPGFEADSSRRTADQRSLAASNEQIAAELNQRHQEQAVKQDVARTRDQQCKDAKERYAKAIMAKRITKSEKDGEREYMSDDEADAYRVRARSDVQDLCGSVPKDLVP